jgi:threonine/homoserine/homoserine lactone efflux protein
MIMTSIAFLYAGFLVGFSIAVPIGPMGLLCIQRTLASGMRVGVSTGLGGATINVVYGAAILFGLGRMPEWMAGGGRVLGALGGLFLLWSAARTLLRKPVASGAAGEATPSPLEAYGSAVLFNATNPLSPILIAALLSPLIGLYSFSLDDAAILLLGIFAAAMTWWICLTGGIALLRSRLHPNALLYVNRIAGMILTVYGLLAIARSAGM